MKSLLFFCGLLLLGVPVLAQQQADEVCPVVVETALAALDRLCSETGRNEACYGHFALQAEAQPGVTGLAFAQPGDIAQVADIQRLTLTPMDTETQAWGVALLRLQANLPDSLPGQNVTMLLFGAVDLSAAEDSPGTPMQAFYFRSGIGDAPCAAAPESGIVLQTPEGAGQVHFTVNGVDIRMGSTLLLQAQPADALYVHVLEGEAFAQVPDQPAQPIPAGTRLVIPLDAEGLPTGELGALQPYSEMLIEPLPPVLAVCPRPVEPSIPGELVVMEPSCEASSVVHSTERSIFIYQASYGFIPDNPEPPEHEMGLSPQQIFDTVSFTVQLNDGAPLLPSSGKFWYYGGGMSHVQQQFFVGRLAPGTYLAHEQWHLSGISGSEFCTYVVE